MKNYKAISKIGEGTFSEVLKIQSLRDGGFYACKQMKQRFNSDRKSGSLALICELMDMNIYELIRGRRRPLSERKVMNYMYQLCKSLDHMHRNGIFHRDVKPENILVKQDVLKLGDFGSCRSVYSRQPYTEYISTRWYRAPECLLTDGFYTSKMDLWSAGCVFYEIASLQPLFPGVNELDQISKIHDVIGTPAPKTLTKFTQSRAMSFDFPFKKGSGIPLPTANLSPKCLSLLHAMVAYDPDERITAHQALQHPYFREQRAAEMQARASRRHASFPEYHKWPIPEDRKQVDTAISKLWPISGVLLEDGTAGWHACALHPEWPREGTWPQPLCLACLLYTQVLCRCAWPSSPPSPCPPPVSSLLSPWPQHRPWRTSLVTRWFRRETFTWQWPHVLFCWGWRCTPHPTLCPFIPEGHTCRRHPVCPVVPGHLHVPLPSLALSRSEGLLGTGSPRHCRESLTAEPSVPPQPHGWPWYWLCLGHGM
ncbi:MAPK/MAK/MRK overlapping kinase isoform X4 [Fukomys damarensis]|uniref:MAPK/MAK/MRK overlapping kinase isoform X4 n=1 Tax=Fukomys damarensis TaxID=885580 RepID=UPI00053FFAD9|nr:MAPK/MAK/MRK overlapping kinase isoform X4 [Fukomys damarensis]